MARMAQFLAGIPETVPLHTVSAAFTCGSVFFFWFFALCNASTCIWAVFAPRFSTSQLSRCHRLDDYNDCASFFSFCLLFSQVNRQCSSGLQACMNVYGSIVAGVYDIGIGAGVESMSMNRCDVL